ncbi:hypothetical protein B0H34DRAFT_504492 [Crassisporium funariophilum]|nr:hypothetical protein B0H34DRAFT_504492 [Crassisporium funariophilum]
MIPSNMPVMPRKPMSSTCVREDDYSRSALRRVVKCKWDYLIVMDYVEGVTLAEVWSTLSLRKKIRVAFTLRHHPSSGGISYDTTRNN